jgi:hypothetical protein
MNKPRKTGKTSPPRPKPTPATSIPATPTHAGDSHNFGRHVTIEGDRVHKPRTLLWEWLMLGAGSPLRALLTELAARDPSTRGAFDFLPELAFSSPTSREGGSVERIDLLPLPELSSSRRRELAIVVGRSLATWSWLGVSDLHWENLALGLDRHDRLIFSPLDIELLFDDHPLPTLTKLLPEADPEYGAVNRHAAGVRRALPFLGKPIDVDDLVAMLDAYRAMLLFFDRHGGDVAGLLAGLPELPDAPIRVLLRGTGDYVRARTSPVWPPLLEAEASQLARGDIPYFFRLYGSAGIHYFVEPTLERLGRLPLKGDVPRLEPLLQLSRGLRSPSRTSLREEGLFAVLGAFDHRSFTGTHAFGDLEVTFTSRRVTVKIASTGDELEGRRDVRSHVGSVYLPCTCGEVSSVLVPAVTVCRPA